MFLSLYLGNGRISLWTVQFFNIKIIILKHPQNPMINSKGSKKVLGAMTKMDKVTSNALKPVIRHTELSVCLMRVPSLWVMGHHNKKNVSYEIQPTSDQECANKEVQKC